MVPKNNLEILEISIVKRKATGIFVIRMMISGEIYNKVFH